jgi:ELWxxDGT repeat protein
VRVADVVVGTGSAYPSRLANINGTLYYAATDGTNGGEVWTSDGTSRGTRMVKNINPTGEGDPGPFVSFEGAAYFRAYSAGSGYQL